MSATSVAAPLATPAVELREVALDDKYELDSGRVYLTGVQALVRLLLLQRQRDALAGLNTAGFVTGYRGSPLGGLDLGAVEGAEDTFGHVSAKVGNATGNGPQREIAGLLQPARSGRSPSDLKLPGSSR